MVRHAHKLSIFIVLVIISSCSESTSTPPKILDTVNTQDEVRGVEAFDLSTKYPNLINTIEFESGCDPSSGVKAVYNYDSRTTPCDPNISSELIDKTKSVAMLIDSKQLGFVGEKDGKRVFIIKSTRLDNHIESVYGTRACSHLRYRSERNSGFCTGFLIDENNSSRELVTAAHCLEKRSNTSLKVIFTETPSGVKVRSSALRSEIFVTEDQIFSVKDRTNFEEDFSILELDREVRNVRPLSVSKNRRMYKSDSLQMIGHPVGLMMKISRGEVVKDSRRSTHILAHLDSFGGNSGSPVISSESGEVVGVLVSGQSDFGYSSRSTSCIEDRVYSSSDNSGELVLKIRRYLN